jgi:ferredoxin
MAPKKPVNRAQRAFAGAPRAGKRAAQKQPTPSATAPATPAASGRERRFPIVGIGASAGGLEALDELFAHMPKATGMAFVVITHQHPGHTSLLPELLGKFTTLTVRQAADGLKVEEGATLQIYNSDQDIWKKQVEKFCENWPPGMLHLERFSAKPQEPAAEADSSFELVLERSGLTLQVPPDKSVLSVIREAGVSVLASCLEGVCGTCETEVIDGNVDHRDSVLNEEEQASNEYMMVCVSRCRSPRLTLNL